MGISFLAMAQLLHPENPFLRQVLSAIEAHLDDEGLTVEGLAEQLHMSRSSLLRKVKEKTGLSVSVYIREVRLHHAKRLLQSGDLSAAEVAYQVGFKSASYFTKCFRESFGYTPGQEAARPQEAANLAGPSAKAPRRPTTWAIPLAVALLLIVAAVWWRFTKDVTPAEKTIAVLPFKNDSGDPANLHLMNGLLEATLHQLQWIEDLQVTSRTSVERYRATENSIPELAKQLGVSFLIEGSGQKVGQELLLTIQLIDGKKDQHLWSKQYRRAANDVFSMQTEISKDIAQAVEAIITPVELQRIEKEPTQNLQAYDYYLKGLGLASSSVAQERAKAQLFFDSALALDDAFALAHAYKAIAYYYEDIFQVHPKFADEINIHADKALLYDPEQPECLTAKALYYMLSEDYSLAEKYFEEALLYAPNSGSVHNFLTELYYFHLPDAEKYMIHAIRGLRTTVASEDSATVSMTFLHLANALAQAGFLTEAEEYVQKSKNYNPQNLIPQYLHTYIQLGMDVDFAKAKVSLQKILQKDSTRLDVIQEIGKVCAAMEDYEEAWRYYEVFIKYKEEYQLDIYPGEDLKIGFVLEQLGRMPEATVYYKRYRSFIESETSIYQDLGWAAYYAIHDEVALAMEHLKAFSQQRDYHYWAVLFMGKDAMLNSLMDHPDYAPTIQTIKDNFWEQHQARKELLAAEGVLASY